MVGGGVGLLAGLGLLAIPGLGPVVAVGLLAPTALGAIAGPATGGIIGALIDSGTPETDAHVYSEAVRRGGTMVSVRTEHKTNQIAAILKGEIGILDGLVSDTGNRRCKTGTLAIYIIKLARLGGYLARTSDPPPGIVVIWRGLARLTDIELGAEFGAAGLVGN